MGKLSLLIFLLICSLAVIQTVSAGSINRYFVYTNATNLYNCSLANISVCYSVDVNDSETYFVMDDLSSSLVICSYGVFNFSEQNHIKWVSLNATSTIECFDIAYPDDDIQFSGQYMIEGMSSSSYISGESVITVSSHNDITHLIIFLVLLVMLFGILSYVANEISRGKINVDRIIEMVLLILIMLILISQAYVSVFV